MEKSRWALDPAWMLSRALLTAAMRGWTSAGAASPPRRSRRRFSNVIRSAWAATRRRPRRLTRTIATAVTIVTTNSNKAAQPISPRSWAKKVLAKASTSDRARATRSQTPASGA
jgi:hypothetical protein